MDIKHKKILTDNRVLLIENIIPYDEWYKALKQQNVLVDSMIANIQALPTREEQNTKFVECLLVRTPSAFHRFCDVLQITGHCLLANHLRQEALEAGDFTAAQEKNNDAGDNQPEVFRKLPNIARILEDKEKAQLVDFIKETEKSAKLTAAWKSQPKDKQLALQSKQKVIEDAQLFGEELQRREDLISELREEIRDLQSKYDNKCRDYEQKIQEIEDEKNKQNQVITGQMNYNTANDNTIKRIKEQHQELETILTDIDNHVTERLKTWEPDSQPPDVVLQMQVTKAMMKRFRDFINHVDRLRDIENHCERMKEEKMVLLAYLGEDESKMGSLTVALEKYIEHNKGRVGRLISECERLQNENETKDARISKMQSEINELEMKVEDLTNTVAELEKNIRNMRGENQKLRVDLSSMPTGKSPRHHEHHEPIKHHRKPSHDQITLAPVRPPGRSRNSSPRIDVSDYTHLNGATSLQSLDHSQSSGVVSYSSQSSLNDGYQMPMGRQIPSLRPTRDNITQSKQALKPKSYDDISRSLPTGPLMNGYVQSPNKPRGARPLGSTNATSQSSPAVLNFQLYAASDYVSQRGSFPGKRK